MLKNKQKGGSVDDLRIIPFIPPDPELPHIKRGVESERRVKNALDRLKEEGAIHDYYKTWPLGELDLRGIDFQVYPEHDWCINLQVKSSAIGKAVHITDYGYSIACVIVDDAMDDRQLAEELKRILGLAIAAITERH